MKQVKSKNNPRAHQKYEININEKNKNGFISSSNNSTSKYSVPDSENFGEKEYKVTTQNNEIKDLPGQKYKTRGPPKTMSIRQMQISYNKKQTNTLNYPSDGFDHSSNQPSMNLSQQQAINMMGANFGEAGFSTNSPYNVSNRQPHFYPQNDMLGVTRNSNSNSTSPMRNTLGNEGEKPPIFGKSSGDKNLELTNQEHMMQNQMMNPLMSQVMMLMQQNTSLMAQQAEFIKNFSTVQNKSKSRSRSRSKNRRGKQ